MWPASSVSGVYIAHPEAHYFGVAKVERDQVEDYAARKGMAVGRGRALARAGAELRAGDGGRGGVGGIGLTGSKAAVVTLSFPADRRSDRELRAARQANGQSGFPIACCAVVRNDKPDSFTPFSAGRKGCVSA